MLPRTPPRLAGPARPPWQGRAPARAATAASRARLPPATRRGGAKAVPARRPGCGMVRACARRATLPSEGRRAAWKSLPPPWTAPCGCGRCRARPAERAATPGRPPRCWPARAPACPRLPMLATHHTLSRTGQVTWGVKGLGGYVYAMAVRSSSPYSVAIGCGDRSIRVLDPGSPDVRRAASPRAACPHVKRPPPARLWHRAVRCASPDGHLGAHAAGTCAERCARCRARAR